MNTDNNEVTAEPEKEYYAPDIGTPLRADAFELDDETKIELIQKHFEGIMYILGLDLEDDSLRHPKKSG